MPLFDYICLKCSDRFEELVSSADQPVICPSCRSKETERLMPRSFGISFNAPGFYNTDYKRKDWQEQTLNNIKRNKKK
jgi:putative FmdB family regulatory protein